jgi:hypothetical protein
MDATELALLVQKDVKGLDAYLDQDDYTRAVDSAVRETGYAATSTNATKIHWLIERAKYAIYGMLLSESAHKFKVKQYSLHHRFEHYLALRKVMDERYNKFKEELPVDPDKEFHIGGMKIDSGFQYDETTGEDTTYLETNVVQFTPTEND